MTLMRESWILMGVCLADLATTLTLIGGRRFSEGNPLMSYYLDLGVWAFVLVKLLLIVMPLVLAEYSKQFRPVFVRSMLRFAIVVYVTTYVTLFAGVNLRPMVSELVGPHGPTSTVAEAPAR
jgi:hypothetical protein